MHLLSLFTWVEAVRIIFTQKDAEEPKRALSYNQKISNPCVDVQGSLTMTHEEMEVTFLSSSGC
eukprot:m.133487 g.133487  ORF g.133487 m.133487 type:complete len:64 (+) comp17543_c1_seq2:18-209(+)